MERSPPRLSGEDPNFEPISGNRCFVRGCNGANDTLIQAMKTIPNGPQSKKVGAKLVSYLKQLADGEQLRSPDRFRTEGDLPGKSTGKFFAVRLKNGAANIRVYIFVFKGDWWISHFTNKKKNKLSRGDKEKVEESYRSLAGNN